MKFVLLSLALFGAAMCHPGGRGGARGGQGVRGGHGKMGPPPPPFLDEASMEAKMEFFKIMRDQESTIAQQKEQIKEWAAKYELTAEVEEFAADQTAEMEELNQNVTELIASLTEVQTALVAIFRNEEQTRDEMKEAIDALKEESPMEVATLFFMGGLFKRELRRDSSEESMEGPLEPRGGPRGGNQGPFGGNQENQGPMVGGNQGPMGGNQGPFGGNQDNQGPMGGNQGPFGGNQENQGPMVGGPQENMRGPRF